MNFFLKLPNLVNFQVERDRPYTCPISFVLSANDRYIIDLEKPCLEVKLSRTKEVALLQSGQSKLAYSSLIENLLKPNRIQICRATGYE